ncbi:TPA: PQQ-like beta-propeller repeat protein [Bacillus pseudomycoides]|nr:PQQ-like beta-propeller repeat protein [Bacillus pseudomycoides]
MEVLKSLEAKSKNAKLTEEEKKEARDILNKLSSITQGEQGKEEARDILNKLSSITQGEQFEQGKYDLQAEFPFGQNWNRNSPYAGTEVNKIKWEYKNFYSKGGIQQFRGQPAIGRDGTIYIENQDHKLYAFNKDGSIKWIKDDVTNMSGSPVIGEDGTIYIAGGVVRYNSGRLTALNPDGSIRWQVNKELNIEDTPIIDNEGTIYVRNSMMNRLEAYNSDGSKKWQSDRITSTIHVSNSMRMSKDGTIYTLIPNENLTDIYAHNKESGKELWKKTLKGRRFGFNLGLNDELFINGELDGYKGDVVTVLDKNGDLIKQWTQVPKSTYGTHSTPVINSKDGTIYIGGNDGLYAYNSDYTLKWKYSTERGVSSTTIDKNSVIYFQSDAELYAVNSDGTLKWKLPHSFSNYRGNNSITIDKDGNLYTMGGAHVKDNKGGGYTDTYYSIMAIGDSYTDNVCTKESTFMEVLKSLEAKSKNAKLTEEEKKEAREILNKISNDLDKKDN